MAGWVVTAVARMPPPMRSMAMTVAETVADLSMMASGALVGTLVAAPHCGGSGKQRGDGKSDENPDSPHSINPRVAAEMWWRAYRAIRPGAVRTSAAGVGPLRREI